MAYVDQLSKNTFICLLAGTYRIGDIALTIGYERCREFAGLHALTGSDVTVKLNGLGTHSWWKEVPTSDKDVVATIQSLGRNNIVSEITIDSLEICVCSVCSKKIYMTTLSETRWLLYCKNPGRSESLPPTLGALRQHTKRANYVAYVWNSSHISIQILRQISVCG